VEAKMENDKLELREIVSILIWWLRRQNLPTDVALDIIEQVVNKEHPEGEIAPAWVDEYRLGKDIGAI
jgi:hypothetical protein